ncbi:NUDIX hydrolase [Candidatus Saccharibacteria bacterium]|nr:NUDIX hydrolase [Candidatus Saccharibacteria bacterium]
MKIIAKVLLYGPKNQILLLQRSNSHPYYALQPDIPGGEVERGETNNVAVARELEEETGVSLPPSNFTQVHEQQVTQQKKYLIFQAAIKEFPKITLSWEHINYSWGLVEDMLSVELPKDIDNYYEMVIKYLSQTQSQ